MSLFSQYTASLPVFMYHYVSHTTGAINVTPAHFEDQCRFLAEHGWRGVSLAEAEAYFLHGEPLPRRAVLFTFDDGFLDNAVYAAPILRRYGHCGVIFAVTERLTHEPECRPTLDDLDDLPAGIGEKQGTDTLQAESLSGADPVFRNHHLGYSQRHDTFLNWAEARRLETQNMAIAAHSARHLAVFASPDWTEVHAPGPRPNTFYIIDSPVPWGMPRFKERPALHSRAFIPSEQLFALVRRLVPQDTAEAHAFFQTPGHMENLHRRLRSLSPETLGRYETDAEREARIAAELSLCARTLAEQLGHPVRSFCWPWGGASDLARNLAQDHGFSVFFTTRMGVNPPANPLAVNRFKVRDKPGHWLGLRCCIYSSPLLTKIYTGCRI